MPRFGDPGHPTGGRKTRYRKDLADAICRGIASGRSSGEVCAELGLPRQTVGEWRGAHPEFRTAYIEAFAARCYGFAEEAVEIIDAIPKNADIARVQRERCRADFRKFFATRLVPMLQDVPVVSTGAVINLYLPKKGSDGDGARVIAGEAVEGAGRWRHLPAPTVAARQSPGTAEQPDPKAALFSRLNTPLASGIKVIIAP